MHKIILPFLGQEVEISVAKQIPAAKLFDLETLLLTHTALINSTLGFKDHNSELERLNSSDIGYPVAASRLFWNYLVDNIRVVENSKGKINPFKEGGQPAVTDDIEPAYLMNVEDQTITRKREIELNAATLAIPFTLNELDGVLKKFGLKDYLISARNHHLARGADSWEVSFDLPDAAEDLRVVINNEAIVLHLERPLPLDESIQTVNPFSAKIPHASYSTIIVEAGDPIQAKLLAHLAKDVTHEYQFQGFVDQWQCGITLFTASGELKQFSPQD